MVSFRVPDDLLFNRGQVADPRAYARGTGCASWLYLNGPEFATMDGGMSYEDVQAAVPVSRNVVSDPPRTLDVDLARRHVEALDQLPRPTLVTCRAGPRASAVVYMYSGLRSGAPPAEVIAAARRDAAPCADHPAYLEWIAESIAALGADADV